MRLLGSMFLGACLCVIHAVHATEYGVGFGLTIDYGVASVYFHNGTTVNIAKIEGPPDYKATMKAAPHIHARSAASLTDSNVIVHPDYHDRSRDYIRAPEIISSSQEHSIPIQMYLPRASSSLQQNVKLMQEYLPPWMGGPKPKILDASTQSLADMLHVLRFAAETYLGAEISNATLTVPFPVNRRRGDSTSLGKRLYAAASTLNLELSTPVEAITEIKWQDLQARRWKRSPYTYFSCHPDDEGFVLAIEFNEAALTATVLVPECFDGEMHDWISRVLHSTELGARELFKSEYWHDTLVNALNDVTAPPIQGVAETDQINMLVLVGDSARDERLHHALRVVLGDQYERLIATVRDDGTPARDPQFRGAASGAQSNWEMNHHWSSYHEHGCVSPGPHPYLGPTVYGYVEEAWGAVREWFRSTAEKNAEAELTAEQERKQLLKELGQHPILIGPP